MTYRKFDFEGDIHESLSCVPLAVRRKLDLAGLKISLAGWQQLPRIDRLALCHLPATEEGDVAVYREFMNGACARAGVPLKPLEDAAAAGRVWNDTLPPEPLRTRLGELGTPLSAEVWGALDEETRYSLSKLAEPKRTPGKLEALLCELGLREGPAPLLSPETVVCEAAPAPASVSK